MPLVPKSPLITCSAMEIPGLLRVCGLNACPDIAITRIYRCSTALKTSRRLLRYIRSDTRNVTANEVKQSSAQVFCVMYFYFRFPFLIEGISDAVWLAGGSLIFGPLSPTHMNNAAPTIITVKLVNCADFSPKANVP